MSNEQRTEGRGQKTEVQVYLKWVGVRMGVYFESAQDGPYGAVIHGDAISVDGRDMVELKTERTHLETVCLCSGLSLHMAEVMEGSQLGAWRPVTMKKQIETAHAGAHEKPDVCRCQCLKGGACGRPVCTGAYKLERICPVDKTPCNKWTCEHAQMRGGCDLETSEPLPPCPFCGSHGVKVENPDPEIGAWWGRCGACGVATDLLNTEAEAEAAWRRRGAKPEADREGGPYRPSGSLSFARHLLTLAEEIDGSNWGMGVTGIIETCRREIAEEVSA